LFRKNRFRLIYQPFSRHHELALPEMHSPPMRHEIPPRDSVLSRGRRGLIFKASRKRCWSIMKNLDHLDACRHDLRTCLRGFAGSFLFLTCMNLLHGQPAPPFFAASNLTQVGVYYYPEAWPSNQWHRDIANIKRLGFEFVHMGEFAWAMMEPVDGKINLDWLERNVGLCADQGLKVVLCTPSATPPAWLTQRHPEVLMVDARGRRMAHGSRQHACWSVDTYRRYAGRITEALGKRFGQDARVWGWQLDNELSHYGKEYCYCDACATKFRAWLQRKYNTLGNLNRDWGNTFWSQVYQDFSQVRIPNPDELVQQVNPHAMLDFQRWFAEEAADYLRFQATQLRWHCGTRQWITSNFMSAHGPVYPPLSAKDLDVFTWTIYPVHGQSNRGPLGYRLGDPGEIGFMHDYLRGINGHQGIMELQPGLVNWGEVNPQPYPGAIYLWIMHAFSSGAELVCTYRYRQPLSGAELYHSGIVGPDGVSSTTGGEQYAQAARDLQRLRPYYQPGKTPPAAYQARKTALLYQVENRWDMDNHKQTVRWDSMGHLFKYHRALKRMGCPVEVVAEDKDFAGYPFLVVPACQLVDERLVQRWTEYARQGGHLVLTCRTGQKDRRGHLWEAPWAQPIHELIGAAIASYDLLPTNVVAKVKTDSGLHEWGSWGEILDPKSDSVVLARYADQFYSGKAAAITRRLGQGSVTYIGVDSIAGELEAELLRVVFERASVPVAKFDEGFLVDWRDGFWTAVNFTGKKQTAPVSKKATLLVGARVLDPAGVAIWME
jgi:beta-galactosidase